MNGGIGGICGKQQDGEVVDDLLSILALKAGARRQKKRSVVQERGITLGSVGEAIYIDPILDVAVALDGKIENIQDLKEGLSLPGDISEGDEQGSIIAALYAAYGLGFVHKLHGAFVLAVHDRSKDLLVVMRDRLGIKPLYYTTTQSGDIVFASDVKALFAHPAIHAIADFMAMDATLSLGYTPGPETLFKSIRQLPAGGRLVWNPGLHVVQEIWWSWEDFPAPQQQDKEAAVFGHETDGFWASLKNSIRQAVNQVETDASCVLMTKGFSSMALVSSIEFAGGIKPVLFSPVYDVPDVWHEETSVFCTQKALQHETVKIHPNDMALLPEFIFALGGASGDLGLFSDFLISRQASRQCTHLISSAGLQELLLGQESQSRLLKARAKPVAFYYMMDLILRMTPSVLLGGADRADKGRRLEFKTEMRKGTLARQYAVLSSVLYRADKKKIYTSVLAPYMSMFIDQLEGGGSGNAKKIHTDIIRLQERYALQDGLLAPASAMAGASNINVIYPFLDTDLVSHILALPQASLYDGGQGMACLNSMVERTMGVFSANKRQKDLTDYFWRYMETEPLRGYFETCLSSKSIKSRGLFDPEYVQATASRARAGNLLATKQIFLLLCLEIWFRIFVDHEPGWV